MTRKSMVLTVSSLAVLMLAFSGIYTSPAGASTFDSLAGDFGVVVFDSFRGSYSDVEKGISAGGDVSLSGYSVGYEGGGIVSGGSVDFSSGSVGRDGSGAIRAAGGVSGSVTALSIVSYDAAARTETESLRDGFLDFSNQLTSVRDNGSYRLSYGSLFFEGEDPFFNAFSVDAQTFESGGTVNIMVPDGSTALVTILGDRLSFDGLGGQIMISGSPGVLNGSGNSRVLWHLPEVVDLFLGGLRAPQGSILAPHAKVKGEFGQMNGVLVAESFSGSTQFNRPGFLGYIPEPQSPAPVPIPAAGFLLVSSFFILGLFGFRSKSRL